MSRSAKDAFVCEVCGMSFEDKEKLRIHLVEHDPDKVDQRMDRAI